MLDFLLHKINKDPTVKRHLLKTLSWRVIGTIDTVMLGWLVTGKLHTGAAIGGLELLTKMVLYFTHERVWHRIRFGLPTRTARAAQVRDDNAGNLFAYAGKVSRSQREALNGAPAFTIWLTGLSGSGKSTIASELEVWLHQQGLRTYIIDGDNTRLSINSDLSFSAEDRAENIRRVAEISKLFNDAGIIVIASFISPFAADRESARNIIGPSSFLETFVDASIDTCKSRDTKGLYRLAQEGKIKEFTGISSPYEPPLHPDIHINTDAGSVQSCITKIINHLYTGHLVHMLRQQVAQSSTPAI